MSSYAAVSSFAICRDTITAVAHQKHCVSLDTDFRGDSMSENKLFGADVTEIFKWFSGTGKLVQMS
ncbi:hypothetical protein NKH84_21445 [Mesorhizobium sp. M0902]|uniref:hypothetical protein n=1 Tax=unclassified Mesorhizobium TaxID=325217 RepID=UPI0033395A2C